MVENANRIVVLAARRGEGHDLPLASRLDLDTSDAKWHEADPSHPWERGHLGVVGDDGICRPYAGEAVPQGAEIICVADVRALADFKSINAVKLSDLGIEVDDTALKE
jgi:hypothetical protein